MTDPVAESMNVTITDREKLLGLLRMHESWRAQVLNLTASENALSPAVRESVDSDLLQRYADFTGQDLRARRYRGTRFIAALEEQVERLVQETFRARYVELRAISGHVAGAAVILGLCRPGDRILELSREAGGHREATKVAGSLHDSLPVAYLPFDAARYNVDADGSVSLIQSMRPRLVILGSSNFLFPHPVQELAQAVHEVGGMLAYDASHVMGFLAVRRFQDPLAEGADIVFGSTHKTMPGPQGGLIFSNRDDVIKPVVDALYPGLVTNHHPFRMPALGLALLELREWGAAYIDQVVRNSQALGEALAEEGITAVSVAGHYSVSHTVLIRVHGFGTGEEIARRLEEAGVIVTACLLPRDLGTDGIRIGTQEITRRGADEAFIRRIAPLIGDTIRARRPLDEISSDVRAQVTHLGQVGYTWQSPEQ